MSKIQTLKGFLVLQILSPIIVVFLRKQFNMPAEGAGAIFLVVGIVQFIGILKWTRFTTSALFWAASAYVTVGSIVFGHGLTHWGKSFGSFSIFGLSASLFHSVAMILYALLIILTVMELYKLRKILSAEKGLHC